MNANLIQRYAHANKVIIKLSYYIVSLFIVSFVCCIGLASPTSGRPEKPFLSSLPLLLISPSFEYTPLMGDLTLFPERGTHLTLSKENKFKFTYKIQPDRNSPAVFIIPGIGGQSTDNSTLYLSELAYRNGYSVITLTSSTHWSFTLAASSKGRSGHLPQDSKDMYNVIKRIKIQLETDYQINPSKWGLMGTSYGTLDGSFLMMQDLQKKIFNFEFIVLINPPLNRSTAIKKVDHYFQNGLQWSNTKQTVIRLDFLNRLNLVKSLELPINNSYDLELAFPMGEEKLSWLLSNSFREIVLHSAYISNLLDKIETPSYTVSFTGTILDYLRESLYKKLYRAKTEEDFNKLENQSNLEYALTSNQSEILKTKRVILFHSTNDYLSFPEGNDILKDINVEKHIYPFGGHLGIITDPNVVNDLEATLQHLN